jgi:hypothetical protein
MLADWPNPDKLELHPADFWLSMTPEQKAAWQRKMQKASGDKGRRIKNSKGSALYQPQAAVSDTPDLPGLLGADLVSSAATPLEVSGEDTETDTTESPGEEQPTDQHGVKVPKKPTPRNGEAPQNRIVADSPVVFDQDEIGIRKHHVRKNNRNEQQYLGMDPDPNPKKVHYDQVARSHNSARNKKEDLDQELVRVFKVHPTYGLPLPTSENPTYDECENPPFQPPSDWTKPLEPTNPLTFIEDHPDTRKLLDEEKKIFLTSRSEWIIRTISEWEELRPKFKMTSALEQMDVLERPPRPPTPEPEIEVEEEEEEEVPQEIKPELIAAVNEAETKRLEAIIKAATTPAPIAPPSNQTRYDPVRDISYTPIYQTPYQPVAPIVRPPPVSNINHQPGGLATLAEAAEYRGSMPPPLTPRQYGMVRNPWAQQAPVPPPSHRPAPGPGTYVIYPAPGPQQSPYTSPRAMPGPPGPGPLMHAHPIPPPLGPLAPTANAGAGAFRELRPAPPQNRSGLPPPPGQQQQQQQRNWYNNPPYS